MLTFLSAAAAQKCLNRNLTGDASKETGITYKLDTTSVQTKGVIYDWPEDETIEDLVAMIDNTDNIIQIERMVKTY